MTGALPPISSSLWQALWDSRPVIFFQLNTCSPSPYLTSSLTRGWVCCLQLLLALASTLRFESRGSHDHILLSHIRDSPNLEGQVSIFISPRNIVAQLYPQALGSLFIASYNMQGYGGGIRFCLHMGHFSYFPFDYSDIASARIDREHCSHNSTLVVCITVAVLMCLLCCNLVTNTSYD
jgi:hypothetical protein